MDRGLIDHLSDLKFNSEIKECFCYDSGECRGKIKNAHSIQRAGRLDLIKGRLPQGDVVYSLSEFVMKDGILQIGVKPIGWANAASTFWGFCDHHDTELFKAIENDNIFEKTPEHYFLHSYRSFAYSYHQLKKALKLNSISINRRQETQRQLDEIIEVLDPAETQLMRFPTDYIFPKESTDQLIKLVERINRLKAYNPAFEGFSSKHQSMQTAKDVLHFFTDFRAIHRQLGAIYSEFGTRQSAYEANLRWMDGYKTIMNKLIQNRAYNELEYLCKIKPGLFPFACAFAFKVNASFTERHSDPGYITLTVLPDKSNQTIILFSCLKKDIHACGYLGTLNSLETSEEFERAVTSLIIGVNSNVFMSPKMWEQLGPRQNLLEKDINRKRPFDDSPEKPFLSQLNFFDQEFQSLIENI